MKKVYSKDCLDRSVIIHYEFLSSNEYKRNFGFAYDPENIDEFKLKSEFFDVLLSTVITRDFNISSKGYYYIYNFHPTWVLLNDKFKGNKNIIPKYLTTDFKWVDDAVNNFNAKLD